MLGFNGTETVLACWMSPTPYAQSRNTASFRAPCRSHGVHMPFAYSFSPATRQTDTLPCTPVKPPKGPTWVSGPPTGTCPAPLAPVWNKSEGPAGYYRNIEDALLIIRPTRHSSWVISTGACPRTNTSHQPSLKSRSRPASQCHRRRQRSDLIIKNTEATSSSVLKPAHPSYGKGVGSRSSGRPEAYYCTLSERWVSTLCIAKGLRAYRGRAPGFG
jgi:hypothetical protein